MRLKERIIFLKPKPVSDGAGGISGGYIEDYKCWADIKFGGSNRSDFQGQTVNHNFLTVKMRVNKMFTPDQGNTFVWRGKILAIHGPIDLGEKNYLMFQAAYDAGKKYIYGN